MVQIVLDKCKKHVYDKKKFPNPLDHVSAHMTVSYYPNEEAAKNRDNGDELNLIVHFQNNEHMETAANADFLDLIAEFNDAIKRHNPKWEMDEYSIEIIHSCDVNEMREACAVMRSNGKTYVEVFLCAPFVAKFMTWKSNMPFPVYVAFRSASDFVAHREDRFRQIMSILIDGMSPAQTVELLTYGGYIMGDYFTAPKYDASAKPGVETPECLVILATRRKHYEKMKSFMWT
jgi:hypothetical protein